MELSKIFPNYSNKNIDVSDFDMDILRTMHVKKSLKPSELSKFAIEEHNERIAKEKLQKQIEKELEEEDEEYDIKEKLD